MSYGVMDYASAWESLKRLISEAERSNSAISISLLKREIEQIERDWIDGD